MISHFSSVRLFVTLWTVAHQTPLSIGFFRQEYLNRLPFPSLGNLSNPGIEPMSLTFPALVGRFFITWAFLIAQLVKNLPEIQETPVWFLVGKICWRSDRLPTPVFLGFPFGSAGEESTWNSGDLGSVPELGRSPREGKGYLLQYSGLENSMDCIVHRVVKSQTRLSDFLFHFINAWNFLK